MTHPGRALAEQLFAALRDATTDGAGITLCSDGTPLFPSWPGPDPAISHRAMSGDVSPAANARPFPTRAISIRRLLQ